MDDGSASWTPSEVHGINFVSNYTKWKAHTDSLHRNLDCIDFLAVEWDYFGSFTEKNPGNQFHFSYDVC